MTEREIGKAEMWRERKKKRGEDETNPSGREETERVYDSPGIMRFGSLCGFLFT